MTDEKLKNFQLNLEEIIKKNDNNLNILIHNNPDADAVCSAYAFQFILKEKYDINAKIIYGGNQDLGIALSKFMQHFGIGIIHNSRIKNLGNLICIDTNGVGNINKNFEKNIVLVIDHHGKKALNDLPSLMHEVGACSTIIFQLIDYLDITQKLKSNPTIATALLFGILMDTNNFSEFSTNSPEDMETFMKLTNFGDEINARYFFRNQKSLNDKDIFFNAVNNLKKIKEQFYICEIDNNYINPAMKAIVPEFLLNFVEIDFICTYSYKNGNLEFSIRNERMDVNTQTIINKLKKMAGNDIIHGGGRGNIGAGRSNNIKKEKFEELIFNIINKT